MPPINLSHKRLVIIKLSSEDRCQIFEQHLYQNLDPKTIENYTVHFFLNHIPVITACEPLCVFSH